MKVITAEDMRHRRNTYLNDLFEGRDLFVFVANETYQNKSYIVIRPEALAALAGMADQGPLVDQITDALETLREKVSAKYRRIRNKRVGIK